MRVLVGVWMIVLDVFVSQVAQSSEASEKSGHLDVGEALAQLLVDRLDASVDGVRRGRPFFGVHEVGNRVVGHATARLDEARLEEGRKEFLASGLAEAQLLKESARADPVVESSNDQWAVAR
jgi:hypothetical protein